MMKKHCTAILLAAGSGSRMKSKVAKQFMPIAGKPLLWYALRAIETSDIIDDCVLVTGQADVPYVEEEIVKHYGFSKVTKVIPGGSERYYSVYEGLKAMDNSDGYVFIHDGARPFLTEKILRDTLEAVEIHHACVTATPSKDTVKLADEEGFAEATPDRSRVYNIQTPQVFDADLILYAYEQLLLNKERLDSGSLHVTDDASVVELFTDRKVKLVTGAYENIKVTTPGDAMIAETLINAELNK